MCHLLSFFLTLRRRTNKVEVIPAVVDRGELEVRGVDEQQQVSKCKGLPSKKQNLVFSKESTPAKDTGTTAPSCFLSGVDEQRKHSGWDSVVVDEGVLEIRGVDMQRQVSKCKGLPSKKQNLISSKESTPHCKRAVSKTVSKK